MKLEINVRFKDIDMLGHINHANYFTYMEEAQSAYMKELDTHFLDDDNIEIVVVSATCNFISQGYLDDTLIVKTKVKKVGNSSFNLTSDIIRKDSNQLIAKGEVTFVFFDIDQQKSTQPPESFKEKLNNNLSNSKE